MEIPVSERNNTPSRGHFEFKWWFYSKETDENSRNEETWNW